MDNTGKSTLVQEIHEAFPSLILNPSIGNKHDLEQIRRQAAESLMTDQMDPLHLWDRARFISEFVYNPIIRKRNTAYGPMRWMHFLGAYANRTQLLIYCHRTPERIRESFDEREQLGGVAQNLEVLLNTYDCVVNFLEYLLFSANNNSRVIRYNYDTLGAEADKLEIMAAVATYMEVSK